MKIYYLEHDKKADTRRLWENIFEEDTEEFLDYYYNYKMKDNKIIVLEEDGDIRSMVQLNPYAMYVRGKRWPSYYIVGVATDKDYRHRGYMRKLLEKMITDMYADKVPFTFLMPAAEAIYKPFDFQFVYDQQRGSGVSDHEPTVLSSRAAKLEDAERLAVFAQSCLQAKYELFAYRDGAYYQTLIAEQRSEAGEVVLLLDGEKLAGYFYYAQGEDNLEVREPVVLPEYKDMIIPAVESYLKKYNKAIKYIGLNEGTAEQLQEKETKPIIMARIIHLAEFLKAFSAVEEFCINLSVKDNFIPENNGCFCLHFSGAGCEISPAESAEVEIDIAQLTGFLMGYLKAETVFDENTASRMHKIQVIKHIFLNEVV